MSAAPGRLLRWLACLLPLAAGCAGGEEERPAPGGMSVAVRLDPPAAPGSAEPNLAVAPDGRVFLTWLEPGADSTVALRFSVLQGGRWSEPRTVARGRRWFVNWADFPSLVALPDGRLAAHWLERDTAGAESYHYGVRIAQSRDGGATWSAPATPHRDGVPAEHGFVSLFPAGGDSLGAVWLDGRKASPRFGGRHETELRYTTLAADGGLGEERPLDERVCDCCQTAMAMTARGPVVAYRDRTADEVRDIHVTRRVGGAWTEGRPVHADGWTIDACPVNGPALSARGERVAVAWFTAARDTARVLLAFSGDAGASFGAPVRVDTGDPAGRVDVEMDAAGGALVSWLERTGGEGAEVRVRYVSAAGRVGEPVTLAASSGARASGFPRAALVGDTVVFAWTEPGTPSRVHVARAALGGAARGE